jgi:hypothetical protein
MIKLTLILIKSMLKHQPDQEQLLYFNNLTGIYSARIFGLCVYRNKELV